MNNKNEVKKNVDEMACKIFEYIKTAEPDQKTRDELFIEIATSFITASLNVQSETLLKDLEEACKDCFKIGMVGLLRYKSGNKSRVLYEDEEDN